jgi:hypothetical protein
MTGTPPVRRWSPTSNAPDTRPWYRQFWPWFLILLPSASVVGGITMLLISLHDPDDLVADDYYKAGLAINRVIARQRAARELGVSARGRLDPGTGEVTLTMIGTGIDPRGLRLRLVHATRAHFDQEVDLRSTGPGTMVGRLAERPGPGNWALALEPADGAWRVEGRVLVDATSPSPLDLELLP